MTAVPLSTETVTPCLMVKNEDFWIHYVLRDILKVFPNVILLDTGSTDRTKEIALKTAEESPNNLMLLEEDYGNDPHKIGNGRNVLREACDTFWMFLVDGDEIWREDKLRKLLEFSDFDENTGIIMVGWWAIQDVDSKLMLRSDDMANRDGLMAPDTVWTATEHPFESYGLTNTYPMERVKYIPAPTCYAWHMRHTIRSTNNWDVYFRKAKLDYYPYDGKFDDPPIDWLGKIDPRFTNLYLDWNASNGQ